MSEGIALKWETACYLVISKEDLAGGEGRRGSGQSGQSGQGQASVKRLGQMEPLHPEGRGGR